MPEGHTLHRLARDHTRWLAGQSLTVLSPQGRFRSGARRLSGCELLTAEAFGKHLIYMFEGQLLHIHLGLYGKFRLHRNPPPVPRGAVRLRMMGRERCIDLTGPNQCELLSPPELVELKSRLGPDPLRSDADPERAWERIRNSRSAIGSLLLNQRVIAGIGNIYRAELLFLLRIHPNRMGRQLSRDEFDALWDLTVRLLRVGVKYNRIITVDHQSPGRPLSRLTAKERLQIYKRSACPRCQSALRSWELGNRLIYACETCQT